MFLFHAVLLQRSTTYIFSKHYIALLVHRVTQTQQMQWVEKKTVCSAAYCTHWHEYISFQVRSVSMLHYLKWWTIVSPSFIFRWWFDSVGKLAKTFNNSGGSTTALVSCQSRVPYHWTVSRTTVLNSLFKVLFNFRSLYLFAIGLGVIFSLTRSLPRTLSCTPKQLDSKERP